MREAESEEKSKTARSSDILSLAVASSSVLQTLMRSAQLNLVRRFLANIRQYIKIKKVKIFLLKVRQKGSLEPNVF